MRTDLSRMCLARANDDPAWAASALDWALAAEEAFPTAPLLRICAAGVRREILGVPAFAQAVARARGMKVEDLRRTLADEVRQEYGTALALARQVKEQGLILPRPAVDEARAWLEGR